MDVSGSHEFFLAPPVTRGGGIGAEALLIALKYQFALQCTREGDENIMYTFIFKTHQCSKAGKREGCKGTAEIKALECAGGVHSAVSRRRLTCFPRRPSPPKGGGGWRSARRKIPRFGEVEFIRGCVINFVSLRLPFGSLSCVWGDASKRSKEREKPRRRREKGPDGARARRKENGTKYQK